MMQLLIDEQQQITSYATFGGLVDGIDYAGPIPATFTLDFQSGRYLLQQNVIVVNPDYVAPSYPTEQPSDLQQAITALGEQAGDSIKQLQQAVTALAQGGVK